MIRFLLGEAGTGKTTLLYENLKKSLDSGAKAILLVPEQLTLTAERELMDRLQLRGMGYLYYYCNRHGLFKRKV